MTDRAEDEPRWIGVDRGAGRDRVGWPAPAWAQRFLGRDFLLAEDRAIDVAVTARFARPRQAQKMAHDAVLMAHPDIDLVDVKVR